MTGLDVFRTLVPRLKLVFQDPGTRTMVHERICNSPAEIAMGFSDHAANHLELSCAPPVTLLVRI